MNNVDKIIYSVITSRKTKKPLSEYLNSSNLTKLLKDADNAFNQEGLLIDIKPGVHVVGDIHGNIDDLLRIFEHFGYPPKEKYLFLGDYEDRGKFGVEVVLFLFALKVKFPDYIFMIRGNHEILHVSHNYGFLSECQAKFDSMLFYQIHQIFGYLPVAAVISKRVMCVHGGIGPGLTYIDKLRTMLKVCDIRDSTLLTDILWSDPKDKKEEFTPNDRGCGQYFNAKALEKFLNMNDLDLLIRSHELCNGYNFPFESTESCITVFSNTDYCGKKNNASVIDVSKSLNVTVTNFSPRTEEEKKKWVPVIPEWIIVDKSTEEKIMPDLVEPFSEIDIINNEHKTGSILSIIE